MFQLSKLSCAKTHREFFNKHKGQKCILLGGGHSIKYMDIKRFSGAKIIGVNLLPFHVDFVNLQIPYNIIIQPRIFVPWFLQKQIDKDFSTVAKLFKKISSESSTIHFVRQTSKFFNLKQINWRPIPSYVWDPDHQIRSSGSFGGAFYAGLSLARLMGFQEVTLVGFDAFTHTSFSNLRWYEYGSDRTHNINDEKGKIFLRYLAESGMKLSTIGFNTAASVEEMEYLDYRELYGTLDYKENHEILRHDAYEALKSYKHLKINV